MKVRIAVMVSGGGTNLQSLIDSTKNGVIKSGEIVVVISNVRTAYALERAQAAGIPSFYLSRKENGGTREGFESAVLKVFKEYNVDLIVLAGFLGILSEEFTARYPKRIINIHPALIPSFCGKGYYGLKVHRAALERGVKVTGATVHFVNEVPDGGEIIDQRAVMVHDGDTPKVLQRRVMEEAEWKILPEAVEKVSADILERRKKVQSLPEILRSNSYPGRGIVLGRTLDGKSVRCLYFIMGRSENSRNRVFEYTDDGIKTEAFDPSKVSDPSLIIYNPVRFVGRRIIVTNGSQTDAIRDAIKNGSGFRETLKKQTFEPDAPNWTPRISGYAKKNGSIELSIIKTDNGDPSCCCWNFYRYDTPRPGTGRFISTYKGDGEPLPSFDGDPVAVSLEGDFDEFAQSVWDALDPDNKVSLYAVDMDLKTGEKKERIFNVNVRETPDAAADVTIGGGEENAVPDAAEQRDTEEDDDAVPDTEEQRGAEDESAVPDTEEQRGTEGDSAVPDTEEQNDSEGENAGV